MLNSLQMGFRTLAIEKRSTEVWQVLGAVKTEFGKFGDVLGKLKVQLQTASNTIDAAETRTRQMNRALRAVEALPVEQATQLLPGERSETVEYGDRQFPRRYSFAMPMQERLTGLRW